MGTSGSWRTCRNLRRPPADTVPAIFAFALLTHQSGHTLRGCGRSGVSPGRDVRGRRHRRRVLRDVAALVRDRLWEKECAGLRGGDATLLYRSDNEHGFAVRQEGSTSQGWETSTV